MSDNPFIHTPEKSAKSRLREISQGLIFAIIFTVVIYFIFLVPSQVDGPSMRPNLEDKELLFASKVPTWLYSNEDLLKQLNLDYKRGDIIIFDALGSVLVKRVIAVGNDRIKFNDRKVYVNDKELIESYIPSNFITNLPPESLSFLPENTEITVPPGYFFVMGDNRTNSKDSRFREVGFIEREKIKGVVFFRIWPLNKFGTIPQGEYTEQ